MPVDGTTLFATCESLHAISIRPSAERTPEFKYCPMSQVHANALPPVDWANNLFRVPPKIFVVARGGIGGVALPPSETCGGEEGAYFFTGRTPNRRPPKALNDLHLPFCGGGPPSRPDGQADILGLFAHGDNRRPIVTPAGTAAGDKVGCMAAAGAKGDINGLARHITAAHGGGGIGGWLQRLRRELLNVEANEHVVWLTVVLRLHQERKTRGRGDTRPKVHPYAFL